MSLMGDNSAGLLLLALALIGVLRAFSWISRRPSSVGKLKRRPPGVPAVPLLGSIPFLARYSKDHRGFFELANKYGPISSLSIGNRYIVVLNSYEAIKEALISQKQNFSDRGVLYSFLTINPEKKGLVCARYDAKYKDTHRAVMGTLRELGFGTSRMAELISVEAREVISTILESANQPIDPGNLISIAVSNVINSIIFGKRFSYDDKSLQTQVHNFDVVFNLFLHTAPMDFFPALRIFPYFAKFLKQLDEMNNMLMDFVREHAFDTDSVSKEFISGYQRRYRGEPDEENTLNVIRDFYAGGTETTATSLKWAMIYLANRRQIQEKLHDEVYDIVGDARIPTPDDKPRMHYTNAFISELLRHTSVVPLSLAHEAREDTILRDYFIPKGTTVFPNLYYVHRDPDVWEKPEEFDPERFLDEEGHLKTSKYLIPFGMGNRSCLGDQLALQELFLFITGITQRFRVKTPEGVDHVDETAIFGVTLSPKPCKLVFEKRSSG